MDLRASRVQPLSSAAVAAAAAGYAEHRSGFRFLRVPGSGRQEALSVDAAPAQREGAARISVFFSRRGQRMLQPCFAHAAHAFRGAGQGGIGSFDGLRHADRGPRSLPSQAEHVSKHARLRSLHVRSVRRACATASCHTSFRSCRPLQPLRRRFYRGLDGFSNSSGQTCWAALRIPSTRLPPYCLLGGWPGQTTSLQGHLLVHVLG